jgi:hypothetical protein
MQMNDNIKDPKNLDELTQTTKGTAEQGALKTIHRNYNKLNGYEAMLHIINRYKFVLYPFIFLSVMGSSYSFYNDFIKAFPMLGTSLTVTVSIFFSIMLEIVRDGSLIALFNSKMKAPSRILVSVIFVVVTAYMYNSHLKAIDVIEKISINYTLTHQDENEIKVNNPRYEIASNELQGLKQDLESKKLEKTSDLMANANSIHAQKRADAINRINKIDAKIEQLKSKIEDKNNEIIGFKDANIKDVEDTQKIISSILLATLLLIESLAMLGAVIKFINKDNAQKEIAKHSEIVEEYVEISEQLKKDNEELTKNLSNVVRGQSESNQRVMSMISDDMRQSSSLNIQFIQAIAQNKRDTMQQMNEVLQFISLATTPNFQQSITTQVEQSIQHEEPKPKERKIGFQANNQTELEIINKLFKNGTVKEGEKLTPKSQIIDINNRSQDKCYRNATSKILKERIATYKKGFGYYAMPNYHNGLSELTPS